MNGSRKGLLAAVGLLLLAGLGLLLLTRHPEERTKVPAVVASEASSDSVRPRDEPQLAAPDREAIQDWTLAIQGAQGEALDGGRLQAWMGQGAIDVKSLGSGVFMLPGARGQVRVRASGWLGHYDLEWEGSEAPGELRLAPMHVVPMRCVDGAGRVLGTLIPELRGGGGLSLEGACAVQWGDGAQGWLRLLNPPPLDIELWVGEQRSHRRTVTGDEDELVFTFSSSELQNFRGGVRFKVVDGGSGQPIPGASYHLGSAGAKPGAWFGLGAAGVVAQAQWASGPADLHLRADGFEERTIGVQVPVGSTQDLGVIELFSAAQLLGSVRTPKGALIEAEVCLVDPDSGAVLQRSEFMEDYLGDHFAFDGLRPGTHHLSVIAAGYARNPVPIELQRGLVQGQVIEGQRGVQVSWRCAPVGTTRIVMHQGGSTVLRMDCESLELKRAWLAPGTYTWTTTRRGVQRGGSLTLDVDAVDLGVL